MSANPWLDDSEIDGLTDPLTQNAAKVRHLRKMGLVVTTRPNGRPIVLRHAWEQLQHGIESTRPSTDAVAAMVPNMSGMLMQFSRAGA